MDHVFIDEFLSGRLVKKACFAIFVVGQIIASFCVEVFDLSGVAGWPYVDGRATCNFCES